MYLPILSRLVSFLVVYVILPFTDIVILVITQFNFVGKLLGPRGNTLKRLQAQTGTKMSVLGKGSMRDKEKVSILSLSI